MARLGLAVNERRQGAEERTHFVEVQAWRDLAEWAAELRKGDGLFVIGRLVNDSWTSSSGERRFQTRVEASGWSAPPVDLPRPAEAGPAKSRRVGWTLTKAWKTFRRRRSCRFEHEERETQEGGAEAPVPQG